MNSPDSSRKVPVGAVVADAVAAFLTVVGLLVWVIGPTPQAEFAGARWSISSPGRAFVVALVILAVRHWRVRDHPILRRLLTRQGDADVDTRLFASGPSGAWHRIGELATVAIGFVALVAIVTWPQIVQLHAVPDYGDPLFSTWRISWIAHQIVRNPLRLFDGNIFHPEPLTLTYSDPVIVPGLMSAPFMWLGVHQLTVYTLLFLSAFVLSGVTTFLLVRDLTGRRGAALIAATMFTLCPFRFEHYSHLELQMTMWMPLVLWSLHRTMASGRVRDGIATGLAFGLQVLSSLYYGCYLAVFLVPVASVLWLARGRPLAPIRALGVGALMASVLVAPVAAAYVSNRTVLGERSEDSVHFYSARPVDYLKPHIRSNLYGGWSANGNPERHLFPGVTPVVLTVVALWPPLSGVRLAYGLGLGVAIDGSLGYNGLIFEWLREWFVPFRGLRVPARFAMLVSFALAVLAGFGAAALFRRFPRWHVPLAAVILAAVVTEFWPRLELRPVWERPPDIYRTLKESSPAVLAEFPPDRHLDARYLYFSTFHWQTLVNGNSGFFPVSYDEFLAEVKTFPSQESITYLRSRGVQYIAVHGAFMSPRKYREALRDLRRARGVEPVARARWRGSESRLFRLQPR